MKILNELLPAMEFALVCILDVTPTASIQDKNSPDMERPEKIELNNCN